MPGSHGSLTKAGKVRQKTLSMSITGTERKSPIPRVRNRRRYLKLSCARQSRSKDFPKSFKRLLS